MSVTMQDYWNEAHRLCGSAARQKAILQAMIDEWLTYENVRTWAEQNVDGEPIDPHSLLSPNPLVRYLQEVTGEETWWIQQRGLDDPSMVIGVADSGVVHISNEPDLGELPAWAQACMAALMCIPSHRWGERATFLSILDQISTDTGPVTRSEIEPIIASLPKQPGMDDTLRSRLEEMKKVFNSFGWWLEKAGTTIHKNDIIMVVDALEHWRTEIEPLLSQDEDATQINALLVAWIGSAQQHLKKEPLSDFRAVWDLLYIDEPNISTLIMKINAFLYKHTGDIRTFLL